MYIYLILYKLIGTEWLRLYIQKEKNPLISLDPNHIYKLDWITEALRNRGNYNMCSLTNIK